MWESTRIISSDAVLYLVKNPDYILKNIYLLEQLNGY